MPFTVLMKVVLAMGAAILFGIIALLTLLALLIPLGVLALGLYLIWVGRTHWNLVTIFAAVMLGPSRCDRHLRHGVYLYSGDCLFPGVRTAFLRGTLSDTGEPDGSPPPAELGRRHPPPVPVG